MSLLNLSIGLEKIKSLIENAIIENGEAGKKSVINSSETINVLHEVVKHELISNGVNPSLIRPLGLILGALSTARPTSIGTRRHCRFPLSSRAQTEGWETSP